MKAWAGLLLLSAGVAQAADMTVVRYLDQDPGSPPYATRILVTPDFLRMDGGDDGGDFVLLDRRQHKVFNVMRESKLAMVFSAGELPPKPAGWKPELRAQEGTRGARQFSLTVNGVVCSDGVANAGVQPDAAHAMAELKAVLAATQYRVWQQTPRELQHDCDLANLVWETGATLKLGLPLEEREFTGRTRHLEDQTRQPLRPELFQLPDGTTAINAPS